MSIINHYLKLKKTHPEHLLFYRIGSFYELYLQDAQKAAGTLNIALTSKKFGDKEIPSCGFPAKYYRQFAIKLLENNHKIAVAEQFENSTIDKNGTLKTKIERKIDHIFSPATFIDENYTPCQENILIAIKNVKKNCHICYGNVLLGSFLIAIVTQDELEQYLTQINPTEIILEAKKSKISLDKKWHNKISYCSFKDNGSATGFKNEAVNGIYNYAALHHGDKILPYFEIKGAAKNHLLLDSASVKDLHLGGLIKNIDQTNSAMGKRFLKNALLKPLCNESKINQRLEVVEILMADENLAANIGKILSKIGDIEKIIAHIAHNKTSDIAVGLKNCFSILNGLQQIFALSEALFWQENDKIMPQMLKNISEDLKFDFSVIKFLQTALEKDENEIVQIKNNFDAKLDKWQKQHKKILKQVRNLENNYVEKLKIKNLKIKFSNILGFYFEIERRDLEKISANFIKKNWQLLQNLSNSARFSTANLQEIQFKTSDLDRKINSIKHKIIADLNGKILQQFNTIKRASRAVALLDTLLSFAKNARQNGWTKPQVRTANDLKISGAWHPLSKDLHGNFITNDCQISAGQNSPQIAIISGANMAGKSTFLRQNAIIIILAQAGSFVPAQIAKIGIRENIFTKITNEDAQNLGHSTFMAEMLQIAQILHRADEKSFIFIDELCQTTNSAEGQEIALAIVKHFLQKNKSLALISTHQPDLAQNCQNLPNICCWQIDKNHQMQQGIAQKSDAATIAKMAGLPIEEFLEKVG